MIRNILLNENNKIPNLAFHSMNICDDFIVIYGGMNSNKLSGDLVFLKLNNDKFMSASYDNNKHCFPKPRHSHSSVYDRETKKLFFYGGMIDELTKYSDELWSLDVCNKPVFNLIKSLNISYRSNHASFIHGRKLYIYGGYGMNKITKKIQILNDLFCMDIDKGSDSVEEIATKGGIDMDKYLFKVSMIGDTIIPSEDILGNIEENSTGKFAFFCDNLSLFFIYDTKMETFSKIHTKFVVPSPRENFTLNRLSDGRIILFGGSHEGLCYNEVYTLVSFHYFQKDKGQEDNFAKDIEENLHYAWDEVDIYGPINDSKTEQDGYNGHASVLLANDHVYVNGGTNKCYSPLFDIDFTNDCLFTGRSKIIDIFNTYNWEPPIRSNAEKLHLYPRAFHISYLIPKPPEGKDAHNYFFFHGGAYDDQKLGKIALCQYALYDLVDNLWVKIDNTEFCPQLKNHACSHILDPERKDFYLILTGGLFREHIPSCENEEKTNKQKERCGCSADLVNDKIYAFRNNKFSIIELENKRDFNDTIKRFAHNTITAQDGCIYLLCGYAQYVGYIVDIIKLKPIADIKNKSFYFKAEFINIGKSMPGRSYATVNLVYNNLVIFGGVRDNKTLNDLWIINMKTWSPIYIDVDKQIIYPRYGMGSVVNLNEEENSARLVIYGGSYWPGKEVVTGATNEIVVFNITFNEDGICDEVNNILPIVYGNGSRRVFHQCMYYKDRMYVFGGVNNLLAKLKMPDSSVTNYKSSIASYLIQCKIF